MQLKICNCDVLQPADTTVQDIFKVQTSPVEKIKGRKVIENNNSMV
jgi:hypothetical protein